MRDVSRRLRGAGRLLAAAAVVVSAGACDDPMPKLAGDGGAGDGGCAGMSTPGSDCVDPIRFDFKPTDVDIVGDLKKTKNIDFTTPKPGEGFQITTQGIKLGPSDDDEWCEAFEVPKNPDNSTGAYCITRFEVAMTKGYHHLFVAKAPVGSTSEKLMEVGKRVRCVGGAHIAYGTDLLPIPLPQGVYADVPYYKGIGEKFTPGQKISVNYHYLNTTDKDIIGVTKLNFHAAPCDGLLEMQQFGFYNQDIAVPPHGKQATTMSGTFTQDVYVLDLFRHTHRWGREVPISYYKGPKDGQIIFKSPDYELGAGFHFPEPVLFHKGEGFTFTCNYENTTDNYIRFGPTANDEMCMLLGTWWVANKTELPTTQHRYKWPQQ